MAEQEYTHAPVCSAVCQLLWLVLGVQLATLFANVLEFIVLRYQHAYVHKQIAKFQLKLPLLDGQPLQQQQQQQETAQLGTFARWLLWLVVVIGFILALMVTQKPDRALFHGTYAVFLALFIFSRQAKAVAVTKNTSLVCIFGCFGLLSIVYKPVANVHVQADILEPTAAAAQSESPSNVDAQVRDLMDHFANPCDDFWQYSCGGWLKQAEIPDDSPFISRTYQGGEVEDNNRKLLFEILESNHPMLGPFYQGCMDTNTIEELGTQPIERMLNRVEKVVTKYGLKSSQFTRLVAGLQRSGIPAFFQYTIADDLSSGESNLFQLYQGGLGLASPKYYLSDIREDRELIVDYNKHIERMLTLLPNRQVVDIKIDAAAALAVEHWLASHWFISDTADFLKSNETYHPYKVSDVETAFPNTLSWDTYFQYSELSSDLKVNMAHPTFFSRLNVVNQFTEQEIIPYLRWQIVHTMSPFLSQAFVHENFAFFNKRVQGQRTLASRKVQCLTAVNNAPVLGLMLGKAFSEHAFAGDAKSKLTNMFLSIKAAFEDDVDTLTWLDEPTKTAALAKSHAMQYQLGYPDAWPKNTLAPGRSLRKPVFAANLFLLNAHRHKSYVSLAGKPVDPNQWDTIASVVVLLPQTVTAFNAESPNQVIVPCGIAQLPLYDPSWPLAMRLGALGSTLGHEFTHSFDQVGRAFGPSGKLENWWTLETAKEFEEKAECIVKQYSSYEALPGLFLRGRFVEQENIADNGGTHLSYMAFKKQIGGMLKKESPVMGLSNEQLFFVSYAQQWCFKMTDDYTRFWVLNNQHSVPHLRVRGVISNMEPFGPAFNCPIGSPYNPKDKCRVW